MCNGDKAQSGAGQRPSPDSLSLQTRPRFQPALVELLRGEPADVRVHSPGCIQEEPAIRRDRLVLTEEVAERRGGRALRVHALASPGRAARGSPSSTRLVRRRRRGESVRERELPRLVHDQNVHTESCHVLARPYPGSSAAIRWILGSAATVRRVARDSRKLDPDPGDHHTPPPSRSGIRWKLDALLGPPPKHTLIQQVGDDAGGSGRSPPTRRPAASSAVMIRAPAYRSCRSPEAPESGSTDTVEAEREAPGGGEEVLAGHEPAAPRTTPERGRTRRSRSKAARRVLPVRKSLFGHPLAEPEERITQRLGSQGHMLREGPTPADAAAAPICRAALQDERRRRKPLTTVARGLLRSQKSLHVFPRPSIPVILGRKPVTTERGSLFLARPLRSNSRPPSVVRSSIEFPGVQIPHEVKVLPPLGLFFPPVVVEEMYPSRRRAGASSSAPSASSRSTSSETRSGGFRLGLLLLWEDDRYHRAIPGDRCGR